MSVTPKSILVGLVAGLASALLVLGSGNLTQLSLVLGVFAALPVLIVGLGWSNAAGAIAVISSAAVVAVALSPLAAAMFAVTTLLPAAWIAHLSNLARPAAELGGPQGQLAWYPLSDIMLHLCALVTGSVVISGYVIGYGTDVASEFVDAFFSLLQQQNPEFRPSSAEHADAIAYMTRLLPAFYAAMQVVILFCAWYITAAIVRTSRRARRPADAVPANLRMSRLSILVMAAGLLLSFASGPLGFVGATLSGGFACGFILAGLAMLHHWTSGRPWRPLALWLTYAAMILFFPLPQFVLLFVGLLETARTSPLSDAGSNDNQPQ